LRTSCHKNTGKVDGLLPKVVTMSPATLRGERRNILRAYRAKHVTRPASFHCFCKKHQSEATDRQFWSSLLNGQCKLLKRERSAVVVTKYEHEHEGSEPLPQFMKMQHCDLSNDLQARVWNGYYTKLKVITYCRLSLKNGSDVE